MSCRTGFWGLPSRWWELATAEPPGLLQADGHHCPHLEVSTLRYTRQSNETGFPRIEIFSRKMGEKKERIWDIQ